jgi:hypothetical protein
VLVARQHNALRLARSTLVELAPTSVERQVPAISDV